MPDETQEQKEAREAKEAKDAADKVAAKAALEAKPKKTAPETEKDDSTAKFANEFEEVKKFVGFKSKADEAAPPKKPEAPKKKRSGFWEFDT